MSRIRTDLQIERGLPTGNKVLAKPDGQTEVVQIEAYKVSPTTWIVDDAGIYENTPGQFEIPSLPYAKDIDVAITNTHKVYRYNSSGGYWELQTNILPPPDLQAVTDVGNETTDEIRFKNLNGRTNVYQKAGFVLTGQRIGMIAIRLPKGTDGNESLIFNMDISVQSYGPYQGGDRQRSLRYFYSGSLGSGVPKLDRNVVGVAGASNDPVPTFRLARDSNGYNCILLGGITDIWGYPEVTIERVVEIYGWSTEGFNIYLTTDDTQFTDIVNPDLNRNISVDLLDGYHASEFALLESEDISPADWVIDEDDMVSDSDTKVPTQQSVKAYVDANAGGDPIIPEYASDTDADNDTNLASGAPYSLTGDRTVYRKP